MRVRSHVRRRGFSLIEVLVALAIVLAGMLAVAAAFPAMFASQRDAEMLTIATSLAQMKAEEIRRDNDQGGKLLREIRELTEPTDPITFVNEPRLSYSFCGTSLLYVSEPQSDPRALSGVARVIIRYAESFRPSKDVVYELRFDD